MPRLSQFLCPTVLALSLLLTGAQAQDSRKIIGYRTVNKEEAKAINANHKPSGDDHYDDEEGGQEGTGHDQLGDIGYFYMTNISPGWEGDEDDWYCIVKADSDKIDAAEKVWIPEYYVSGAGSSSNPDKTLLWGVDEKVISEYMQTLRLPEREGTPDPAKALRFSYIAYWDKPQLQMLIPDQVLRDDELDLWAQCYETQEELKEKEQPSEDVEWTSWRIAGGAGDESESWPWVRPGTEDSWPYMSEPGEGEKEA